MDKRAFSIIRTLLISLLGALVAAAAKMRYGQLSGSLAFVADGVHSLFDAAAVGIGMLSIVASSKPPDEGHPYGHRKFETLSAIGLALLLLVAAFEVGSLAVDRMRAHQMPYFTYWSVVILLALMACNLIIARLERAQAREHSSYLLAADSAHNQGDFLTTGAVLMSVGANYLHIPFVDPLISLAITIYLVYLSVRLIEANVNPLVDRSVLDPKKVEEIAAGTEGVMMVHQIRSRGELGHHFLDLNIHLPGEITLERAHQIAHDVEHRLKEAFPGLVDVVIHTEPHDHPPCTED